MILQPNEKYEATVKDAYLTASKNKGTAGIFFAFETEAGPIEHTAWLTPATAERLKETLGKCFGTTPEQLQDEAYLTSLGTHLRGHKLQITTDSDEYNGDERVIVKWMNPAGLRPLRVAGDEVKRFAGLFGGGPVSSPEYTSRASSLEDGITDSDIPF